MKIEVDPSLCIGAGLCAFTAEELLDQDDNGIVVLLDSDPPPRLHEVARRAESLCPARAITIREPR